jgi:uncharacterized membrane protein YozB (DUF420 family)
MPYRHAWLFVLALIAATVLAFWPGYFSVLRNAPIAFHLHGLTASLWMALLVAQSWTVHHGRRALHRTLGPATFVAVPLFIMGGFGVIQSMARATASGADPFYQIYGARLGSYDVLATATFAWVVGSALKERRNVQLHARYMLSTTLLLIGPVFARITDRFLPGFIIRGPQDFPLFAWNVHLVALIGIGIAAWLYAANRRFGRPWLIVGGVTLLQSILFETLARTAIWQRLFESIAFVPTPLWLALGLVAGIAAVWFGWNAIPTRRPRAATA